jgi:hypothetical protein
MPRNEAETCLARAGRGSLQCSPAAPARHEDRMIEAARPPLTGLPGLQLIRNLSAARAAGVRAAVGRPPGKWSLGYRVYEGSEVAPFVNNL